MNKFLSLLGTPGLVLATPPFVAIILLFVLLFFPEIDTCTDNFPLIGLVMKGALVLLFGLGSIHTIRGILHLGKKQKDTGKKLLLHGTTIIVFSVILFIFLNGILGFYGICLTGSTLPVINVTE